VITLYKMEEGRGGLSWEVVPARRRTQTAGALPTVTVVLENR